MTQQSLLKRPDGSWVRSFRWDDTGKRDFLPMPPVTEVPPLPAFFRALGDAEITVDYLFQACGVRARIILDGENDQDQADADTMIGSGTPVLEIGIEGTYDVVDRVYQVVLDELELEQQQPGQPDYPFPALPALYVDRMEAEVVAEVMKRTQRYESHIVERRVTRLVEGEPRLMEPPLYELRAGCAPTAQPKPSQ